MTKKNDREKGLRYQSKTAKWLTRWWPDAHSTGDARNAGPRGAKQSDVEGTPLHIECKCQRKPNLPAALRQAEDGAAKTRRPAVVIAHRIQEPGRPAEDYVVMRPELFAELIDAAMGATFAIDFWRDTSGEPHTDDNMPGRVVLPLNTAPAAKHPWRGDDNIKSKASG